SGLLLFQVRYGDLDGVVGTGEVDVDDIEPAVVTGLHGGDAGIGHHDVEPTELVYARLHRRGQCGAITDVGLTRHDAGPGVLDELDGLRHVIRGAQRIRHAGDLVA